MKLRFLFPLLLLPLMLFSADEFFPEDTPFEKGGVLLELFTSEGCSSCPPVDEALQKLIEEAEAKEIPVHLIAWHVDYWDRLRTPHGVWKDPFSSRKHTLRQRVYATEFVKQGHAAKIRLITPQFLVNGRIRKSFASRNLMEQFQEAATTIGTQTITGSAKQEDGKVSVHWSLKDSIALDTHIVTVVLTESDLTSHVTAGENFGKTFVHHHVARAANSVKPKQAENHVTLPFPSDWKGKGAAVTILLQNHRLQVVDYLRMPLNMPQQPE